MGIGSFLRRCVERTEQAVRQGVENASTREAEPSDFVTVPLKATFHLMVKIARVVAKFVKVMFNYLLGGDAERSSQELNVAITSYKMEANIFIMQFKLLGKNKVMEDWVLNAIQRGASPGSAALTAFSTIAREL